MSAMPVDMDLCNVRVKLMGHGHSSPSTSFLDFGLWHSFDICLSRHSLTDSGEPAKAEALAFEIKNPIFYSISPILEDK
jgi:hypothetical protein